MFYFSLQRSCDATPTRVPHPPLVCRLFFGGVRADCITVPVRGLHRASLFWRESNFIRAFGRRQGRARQISLHIAASTPPPPRPHELTAAEPDPHRPGRGGPSAVRYAKTGCHNYYPHFWVTAVIPNRGKPSSCSVSMFVLQ